MKAKFWWALRYLWHRPQWRAMRASDGTTIDRIVKTACAVWARGPLACHGDEPGFDYTRCFCEWLEANARRAERREAP